MTQFTIRLILLIATIVALSLQSISAESVDPGADFGGYVEELQRMEFEEAELQAKVNAHEEWRQTTWTGTAVRKIQGIALHFKPFLLAVQDALNTDDDDGGDKTLEQAAAYIGIRMLFVILMLMIFYVGGKLFQIVLGSDIEIVQEVVVVHEHETEAEAAKARQGTTRSKRKKQKQKDA